MALELTIKEIEKKKQNAGFFLPPPNSSAWEIQNTCKNYSPESLPSEKNKG